jgi:hypothetical protein
MASIDSFGVEGTVPPPRAAAPVDRDGLRQRKQPSSESDHADVSDVSDMSNMSNVSALDSDGKDKEEVTWGKTPSGVGELYFANVLWPD